MVTDLIFPPHGTYLKCWPNLENIKVFHCATLIHYREVEVVKAPREGNVIRLDGVKTEIVRQYAAWKSEVVSGISGFMLYSNNRDGEWDSIKAVEGYLEAHNITGVECAPVYRGEITTPYTTADGGLLLRVNDVFHWKVTDAFDVFGKRKNPLKLSLVWLSEDEFASTILADIIDRLSSIKPNVLLPR